MLRNLVNNVRNFNSRIIHDPYLVVYFTIGVILGTIAALFYYTANIMINDEPYSIIKKIKGD